MGLLSNTLLLPAVILAALGFVVPRIFARVLPEGVWPLLLNGFLSTLTMFVMSTVFFFCLYLWQGAPLADLLDTGIMANVVFFGKLGISAAIIWAPILVLSVAGLPRKWVNETW